MPATNRPQRDSTDEPRADDEVIPVPDEDGPHDVPDDKVIEKTLPERAPGGGDKGW
jgi:hypothetical protein